MNASSPSASIAHAPLATTTAGGVWSGRIGKLFTTGLGLSATVSAALTVWILYGLGGRAYYATALAVRGYSEGHRLLRPSGPAGQMFGVVGTVLMLMPFLYMARKRVSGLKGAGNLKTWLEVHLFCGVVGPVLITFHTSFKFNGIVSAAYWSMAIVVSSGFIGRYLYVRIPRSIRGNELTRAELDARANELKGTLAESVDNPAVLDQIERFERKAVPEHVTWFDLLFGEVTFARRLRVLDRELGRAGLSHDLRAELTTLAAERSTLLRRAVYLQRTKTLFGLWHVFHLPLVYLMLVIVVAHVGITLYMGYVPFRW